MYYSESKYLGKKEKKEKKKCRKRTDKGYRAGGNRMWYPQRYLGNNVFRSSGVLTQRSGK